MQQAEEAQAAGQGRLEQYKPSSPRPAPRPARSARTRASRAPRSSARCAAGPGRGGPHHRVGPASRSRPSASRRSSSCAGGRPPVDRPRQPDRRRVAAGRGAPEGHRRPVPRRARGRRRPAREGRPRVRTPDARLVARQRPRRHRRRSTPPSPPAPTCATPRPRSSSRSTGVLDGSAVAAPRPAPTPRATAPTRRGLARAAVRRQGRATDDRARRPTSSRQRWSAERDLADTLETLAVAGRCSPRPSASGAIDRVEDELFRFERIVAGDPGLRDRSDRAATPTSGQGAARARPARGQGRPGDRSAGPPGRARPARAPARPGARGLPPARGAASRRAHRAGHRRRSAHRAAARPAAQRARGHLRQGRQPAGRRGPRASWAASGSRSATRSSTAPSCAASTRPADT